MAKDRKYWRAFATRKLNGTDKIQPRLEQLRIAGLLHPTSLTAADQLDTMEALGYGCNDPGLLFMLQAHLWGAWSARLHFHAHLAKPTRAKPLLALAMTEAESGADVHALRTFARRRKAGWVLRGSKSHVTNAAFAFGFFLFARTGEKADAISCFFVPAKSAGLRIAPVAPLLGLETASVANLHLINVALTETSLVGQLHEGMAVFRHCMAWERSLVLAYAPGRIAKLREEVWALAEKKIRFGAQLSGQAGFRAQLALVDECVEKMRGQLRTAALELDAGGSALVSSARAKVEVSRAYETASRILLQMAGKEGLARDSNLAKNFRASVLGSIYSGPNELLDLLLEKFQ